MTVSGTDDLDVGNVCNGESESVSVKLGSVNSKSMMDQIKCTVIVSDKNGVVAEEAFDENTGKITIPNPVHWTVENPHLYDVKIIAGEDTVDSYFALRTVTIENINGVNRVCLNGKPIFLHGVLDQGYYPDGIYTAPTEEDTKLYPLCMIAFP